MKNIKIAIGTEPKVSIEQGLIYTGIDNLELLKQVPDNTVDLIYIDPPYLTNKTWSKNGWEFDDKFEDMWSFLFFLGERLIEAKRVMRTRHYQLVGDILYEDGDVCTYEGRRNKILDGYSGKGKRKKLLEGIDVGASIFVHIDYRTNSEVKTWLMDPLFGEGMSTITIDDLNNMMRTKIGKELHVPVSIPSVKIEQGPDIILDFFGGSLSSCAAAYRTGRRFIGIELNETEQLFLDQIDGMAFGCDRKD